MSVIPISNLSAPDLALLGNNLPPRPRQRNRRWLGAAQSSSQFLQKRTRDAVDQQASAALDLPGVPDDCAGS